MNKDRGPFTNSSPSERWLALASFLVTFFPVLAAAVLFAFQEKLPGQLESRMGPILAAILIVFLVEIWRSDRSRRRAENLLLEVSAMVTPDISSHSMEDAFDAAFRIHPKPQCIRIFALTSWRIQPMIKSRCVLHDIDEVDLLLVNPKSYIQNPSDDLGHESRLSITWNWLAMVKDGDVKRLSLNQFNFYPTEWFVLLDNEVVIFGDYVFESENIAKAYTERTVVVGRNNGAGSALVSSFEKKFLSLFKACYSEFGTDGLSGVVTPDMEIELGRWPFETSDVSTD
jgi:hypothetical protein